MKAILVDGAGGPEKLRLGEAPDPILSPGMVLLSSRATALNGADLLQRRGLYPPPAGASPILGMEVAGVIEALGEGVSEWKVGDRVMALLSGGGYAEKVAVSASVLMRIPEGWSFAMASAVPEVFLTAYLELVRLGRLSRGESVLIHAGGSGVGTAAIQIARVLGAKVLVTAGSTRKLEAACALGASAGANYHDIDFAQWALSETAQAGVDCILDLVGAAHWEKNLRALKTDGRILLVGLGGGARTEVDFRELLRKRTTVIASTLRARSDAWKGELTREFWAFAASRFASGELKPVVDREFPWQKAAEAHAYLESQAAIGKVVLRIES